MEKLFRQVRFCHGMEKAAVSGDIKLIDWRTSVYLPDHESTFSQVLERYSVQRRRERTLACAAVDARQGPFPTSSNGSMDCAHASVLHWLHEQEIRISVTVFLDEVADLELLQWTQQHRDLCKHVYKSMYALEATMRRGDLPLSSI